MTDAHWVCKYGTVNFNTESFPGCCGITVLFAVKFLPNTKTDTLNLYKAFQKWLQRQKNKAYWEPLPLERALFGSYGYAEYLDANKLLMADRIPSKKNNPSIYDFCTKMEWKKAGIAVKGLQIEEDPYKICVFEWNRRG